MARTSASWVALAIAALSMAVGATVLTGWLGGWVGLTTLGSAISQKANAATCFVLLGIALLRVILRGGAPGRAGAALALVAAAIGALTLLEHVARVDLGIDQLLAHEAPGALATAAPGRMGPPASTSFLLLGLSFALAGTGRPRLRGVVQAMLLTTAAIALLPLVGYAYQAKALYAVAQLTGTALVTACTIEALAIGGLLAIPGPGLVTTLRGHGAGASLARRTPVYLLAVPLVVGSVVVQGVKAGLYDGAFGVTILVVALMISLTLLAWREAARVARSESGRDEAEAALLEANRRKDEFLGVLSHELRNPLASIRNSVEVLRRAPPGTRPAERAQAVVDRQTELLTRLVDDLLDVTRIVRGKIELRRRILDLRDLVRRAADDSSASLRDRGVVFDLELPGEPVWADADETRIAQVVSNLLHNAEKFTPAGGRVRMSLASAGGRAEIRVRDTGQGIGPSLLPTIFEPFVQGEPTHSGAEGGLGLGLALVKGITDLHGGTVGVESAGPGLGAEFTVRLPLVPAPAPAAATPAPSRAPSRLRLLIVDDNPDAADSLAEVVQLLGHSVEVAYDGASAVAQARARWPDAVLCDLGLPGMSGYDVARALRAEAPAGKPLRLIAVSGYTRPEDVRRALEAGFDAHLPKPCDAEAIERMLA